LAGHTTREPSLGDIIERRGIRRVAYFHCDHFEPWHAPRPANIDAHVSNILRFADESAANEFSRKLTLFYKPPVFCVPNARPRVAIFATPNDPFGFVPRPPFLEEAGSRAMTGLIERVPHEVQVHVHHEEYTYNTGHTDPRRIEAFGLPDSHERDAARFELALKLGLDAARRETGLDFQKWFFVHGQWALNASDPSVCHITNEIEILLRNGGLGDFTFPAGRSGVNPILEVPHFVRPVDAAAGYRQAAAEPELAFGNASAALSKFFIWASPIRHRGSSLDYYSDHVVQDLADPEGFARRILEQSVVSGGSLFFKTHAHSMHPNYVHSNEAVIFPHQHPGIRRMMGVVFDAASRAGASVDFLTASEVYAEFTQPRPAPAEGFRLTAPIDTAAYAVGPPVLSDSSTPLAWTEDVNSLATVLVLELVASERAAIGYYEARARQTEILAPYEARLARALLGEPRFDVIYEVGAGLAALTLCLALNGASAIGMEKDAARARIAQTLLDRLALDHPELVQTCEIRHTVVPEGLRGVVGQNSALVFTNIAASITPLDLDELIVLAAGFRAIVVDLSRFFVPREKAAQVALLDRFILAGWGEPAPISSASDTYWMFRKPAMLDPDDD
jgi:hypothetical protein